MTTPIRPTQQQDPLSFLNAPAQQEDPLSFLGTQRDTANTAVDTVIGPKPSFADVASGSTTTAPAQTFGLKSELKDFGALDVGSGPELIKGLATGMWGMLKGGVQLGAKALGEAGHLIEDPAKAIEIGKQISDFTDEQVYGLVAPVVDVLDAMSKTIEGKPLSDTERRRALQEVPAALIGLRALGEPFKKGAAERAGEVPKPTAPTPESIAAEEAAKVQAAALEAKAAEKNAATIARRKAGRAWESGTPEMRKVLLPEADENVIGAAWKDLPRETRQEIIDKVTPPKVEEAAKVAEIAKAAETPIMETPPSAEAQAAMQPLLPTELPSTPGATLPAQSPLPAQPVASPPPLPSPPGAPAPAAAPVSGTVPELPTPEASAPLSAPTAGSINIGDKVNTGYGTVATVEAINGDQATVRYTKGDVGTKPVSALAPASGGEIAADRLWQLREQNMVDTPEGPVLRPPEEVKNEMVDLMRQLGMDSEQVDGFVRHGTLPANVTEEANVIRQTQTGNLETETPAFERQQEIARREQAVRDFEEQMKQSATEAEQRKVADDALRELGGDDLVDLARTTEGKLKAGLDPNAFDSLGANLYANDLAKTIAKEGLQNAIDAVRPTGGRVFVWLRDEFKEKGGPGGDKTITFMDEGLGMSPDIIENQFLDIGGTDKPENASGGLGLAKVALFYNAARVELITVADTPEGRIQSNMVFSGDDWIKGNINPPVTRLRPDAPTGTKISITVKPEAKFDLWQAGNFLKESVRHSPAADIYFADQYTRDATSAEPYKFSHRSEVDRIEATNEIFRETNQYYDVRAYESTERHEYRTGWDQIEIKLLNRGYYQATYQLPYNGEGPKYVIVDVDSKVPTSDTNYPFTSNREQLKGPISKGIENVIKELRNIGTRRTIQRMTDAFAQSPHIKGTPHGRVIDTSMEIPKEFVEKISKSDYAARLVNILDNVTELASSTVRRKIGQVAITTSEGKQIEAGDYFFGGIGLGKTYLGVNIDITAFEDMARQEGIKSDLRTVNMKEVSGKNAILINPFSIFKEVQLATAEEPYSALTPALADHTIGTVIHEVLHNLERGHGEDFAGVLTRALGALRQESNTMYKILSDVWHEVTESEDFIKDAVAYEKLDANKNAFSNFSGHLSNIEGSPLGEPVTGGKSVRGQGSVEGGKGPGTGRPEDVSRGEGNGQGARNAATEVERTADAGSLASRLGPELTEVVRGLKDQLYKAKPEERPAILARIKDIINGLDKQDGLVTPGEKVPVYGKEAPNSPWSGVVDRRDGTVEDTYTYRQAEAADFHHSNIVPRNLQERINEGTASYFYMDPKTGQPRSTGHGPIPPEFVDKIKKHMAALQATAQGEKSGIAAPDKQGKPVEMGGQGGEVSGGAPSVGGGTANAQVEAPRAPEVAASNVPRTKADVQRDIDKLNDEFDKGGLSDQDFNTRMEQLVKEKKIAPAPATPKAVSPLEEVKQSGRYNHLTRAQIDEQVVKSASTEQLRAQQQRINFDMQMESNDVVRASLKHEKQVVQGELRWRKPVETLTTESLNTHARELEAKWEQGDPVTKGEVAARLKLVDEEIKKRKLPNPIDIIGDERGFLNINPASDPLEAKIDPNLPDYTKRILGHLKIDMKGDQVHPGMLGIFGNLYAKTIRGTYAAEVFDHRMGLIKGSPMKQAGAWAEMLSGAAGRAMRMLNDGPFRWAEDGNLIQSGIRGVREILAPFKGRLNELRAFEIARYTIDLFQRNRQTGVELIDSIREVNNAAPDIRAAADELVVYRRGVLQYLTDSGMFSEAARQALLKLTDAYVPLYRWLEGKDVDSGVDIVGPKTGKGPSTAGPGNQVKRLIGGVRKIVDPFRSTVDQTRRFVRAADMNRIGLAMVNAAEANPELARGMIWKEARVRATADPSVSIQADNLLRRAKAHQIDISKETAMELAEGLNEKRLSTRSDKLHVWRDGKMEVWNIAPELADMYKGFQPYEMHWMVKFLGFVPQLAKIGITDNPAFAFINSFRDSFDAFAQSKYGFQLGSDSMRGFFESVTNSEYHKEFRASAGTAGGISSKSVTTLDESVLSVLPKTPGDVGMHIIKHPVDALREFSLPFEEAARMGEFIRARKAGASVFEAGIGAIRVTTNFRQHGLSMQGLNHIVMFLNPALQSLDTFGRAVRRNPQRVIATGIASVMLPSIYLWAANRDDKEIQELRKSRFGSSSWFIRMPSGQISRYPKPFIFGAVFGTGVESALDAAYDSDPEAGQRFIEALVDQIPYNLVPTSLNLTLGLASNKDFSTGAPIAPDQLETGTSIVEPRYRARPETGPTARKVGDLLNISPAKIEFAVRNALGTLGFDALRGLDMVNDARERYPTRTAAETPIVGRFLARYPTQGAHSLRKFYDDAKKVEEAGNTLNLLEKQGDSDKAKAYVHDHIHEIAMVEAYADMRSELADIRGTIQAITDAPSGLMKSKDKREKIDFLMGKMIEISRQFNETMAKVKINPPQ